MLCKMYNYENEFRIVFIENNEVTDVTFAVKKQLKNHFEKDIT